MAKNNFSEGHFMSSVKIGPKGQVVIPKEVRTMFNVNPGDTLLLMADIDRGIAIQPYEMMKSIVTSAISENTLFMKNADETMNGNE